MNYTKGAWKYGGGLAASIVGVFVLLAASSTTGVGQPLQPAALKYHRISDAEIRQHIDREWVKKSLVNDLLDYWLKASVMPNGFIEENLDRQWKLYGTQREASLNGQGRQLYTMVIGLEVSEDKRYLDAVIKGADFLMKMHDDKYGGYYNRVSPDLQTVIDDTKTSFTSFVIFSLAHAARVTKDPRYANAALNAFREVRDKMRDGPFFRNSMTRDFSGPARPRAARGHGQDVHQFEALLALYDATRSKEVWAEITAEMAAMEKFFNRELGYYPESYDESWKPLGTNKGHLFEWASLFSRAVELGADPKFIELGSRTIDFALKTAYNNEIGGVVGATGKTSRHGPNAMLWWPQCELLKATAHYAILRGRSDLWPYYHKTLDLVKKEYLDTQYGGWFEAYDPGSPRQGEPAFVKGAVDGPEWGAYHQTSMFYDIWRITDPNYKPEPAR